MEDTFGAEEIILDIIESKRNESAKLDYKLKDYEKDGDGKKEAIKDIIAMLNTEEAVGEDKYLIFGIVDGSMYRKGITEFRDDNEYQDIVDNITPRPCIETGIVSLDKKKFGFIKINKANDKSPYSVGNDTYFHNGTSFIRIGSNNVSLTQIKREELMLKKLIKYPTNFGVKRQIELMAHNREKEYSSAGLKGGRTINPSFNNGLFTIGEGMQEFKLKFQSASNFIARIYKDFANIEIGFYKETLLFEEIEKIEQINLQIMDFSSRVVDFGREDLAVIINQFDKCLLLEFTSVESKSHGCDEDKVSFNWKILN